MIKDNVWIATEAMVSKGVIICEVSAVASMANAIKSVVVLLVVDGNSDNMLKNRILTVDDGMSSSYFRYERGKDALSF